MKHFLIIQTAFIGDVILATPLIEKLHKFYPDAKIDFLCRSGNEELLINHPYLNEIIVWDKKKKKYSNLFKVASKIRKNKYTYILNLQRFFSTGLLTVLSGTKVSIGFDKNPLSLFFTKKIKHSLNTNRENPHEIIRNLNLIAHLTDDCIEKPRLYPSQKDYEKVAPLRNEKYICIAPASIWFTKQFPSEKWAEFINAIEINISLYFIGSKSDQQTIEKIISKCSNSKLKILNLSGKLSLLESAALLQSATMNFVNDSAPLHICSAMNAPTTAIFCSTLPSFGFGPLADNSQIIEAKEKLYCRPCNNHGLASCPEKHFKCAYLIETKKILETISRF